MLLWCWEHFEVLLSDSNSVDSDVWGCHVLLKGWLLVVQADFIPCLMNAGDDGADWSKASGGKVWHQALTIKVGQTVRREHQQTLHVARTLDITQNSRKLVVQCSGQADSQLSASFFLHSSHLVYTSSIPVLGLKRRPFFQTVISSNISSPGVCVCFLTGRPMGLQSCKPCNSCLQSKEECRPAGGCLCVCDNWRYCSDRCCDICCQMCVDVCSGLCSGDCSYTFCTLCLSLAQNCVSLFTTQQTETSEAQRKSIIHNATIMLPSCAFISASLNLTCMFLSVLEAMMDPGQHA